MYTFDFDQMDLARGVAVTLLDRNQDIDNDQNFEIALREAMIRNNAEPQELPEPLKNNVKGFVKAILGIQEAL